MMVVPTPNITFSPFNMVFLKTFLMFLYTTNRIVNPSLLHNPLKKLPM